MPRFAERLHKIKKKDHKNKNNIIPRVAWATCDQG